MVKVYNSIINWEEYTDLDMMIDVIITNKSMVRENIYNAFIVVYQALKSGRLLADSRNLIGHDLLNRAKDYDFIKSIYDSIVINQKKSVNSSTTIL